MKSKSQSQANQTSNQIDNKIAADGNAIVLKEGAHLEQLSDDVALAALDTAKDTATGAYDAARNQLDRSLDYGERIFESANETLNNTLARQDSAEERNAQLSEALSELAVSNVTRSANPDAANTQTLIKWGLGMLAAYLAIKAFKS